MAVIPFSALSGLSETDVLEPQQQNPPKDNEALALDRRFMLRPFVERFWEGIRLTVRNGALDFGNLEIVRQGRLYHLLPSCMGISYTWLKSNHRLHKSVAK